MAQIERLTVTPPSDMAAIVKGAVAAGDYASSTEAVRDWKLERAVRLKEMEAPKANIDKGPGGGPSAGLRRHAHHRTWEETIGGPLVLRITDAAEAGLVEI